MLPGNPAEILYSFMGQESESSLHVGISLNILISQIKYLIKLLITAFEEIDFLHQVIVKFLEFGLQILILPNSKLPNTMEYSLRSSRTFVVECHFPQEVNL